MLLLQIILVTIKIITIIAKTKDVNGVVPEEQYLTVTN